MSLRKLDGWRLEGKNHEKRHGALKDEDLQPFAVNTDQVVEAYPHRFGEREGWVLVTTLEQAYFVAWNEAEFSTFVQSTVPAGGV